MKDIRRKAFLNMRSGHGNWQRALLCLFFGIVFLSRSGGSFLAYAVGTEGGAPASNEAAAPAEAPAPAVTAAPASNVEISFSLSPENGEPVNNIYNGDIKVSVHARAGLLDPATGLRSVEYTVYNAGVQTQSGTLFSLQEGQGGSDGEADRYEIDGEFLLKSELNEGNEILITVLATDKAGNPAAQSGQVAIDATAPLLRMEYDNNEVQNGKYFKQGRVAYIAVTERNFSPDSTLIQIESSDAAPPSPNGWTRQDPEDGSDPVWTTAIPFTEDGEYLLRIYCIDSAGNAALKTDYGKGTEAPLDFCIDKTAPGLGIDGLSAESVNPGNVGPSVHCEDRNLDKDSIRIRLSGEKHVEREPDGDISEGEGSYRFSLRDFPHTKSEDDVYRLFAEASDLAGNTASAELRFSVNRFGPTFILGEGTRALNGKYAREPSDIELREISLGPVRESSMTIFRNAVPRKLEAGKDYSVESSEGSGGWVETSYTIARENFSEDALYSVNLRAEDQDGAVTGNTQEEKGAAIRFGIDRTAPELFLPNLETGGTYPTDKLETDIVASDNLRLESLVVYFDGEEARRWNAEEIAESGKEGVFPFLISGNSTAPHTLRVLAVDAAGNQSSVDITDFIVTTNPIARFLRNRILMQNALIGLLLAVIALFLVVNLKEIRKKLRK